MEEPPRSALALLGGFIKPRDHKPHGTLNSSYVLCQALAESPRYRNFDVYLEEPKHLGSDVAIALPKRNGLGVFEKPALAHSPRKYHVVLAANGEQIATVPWTLRPRADWAPVVCSIGTTHVASQWSNLLVGLSMGALRASDGFVFKSQAARRIFRNVLAEWTERFGFAQSSLQQTAVIGNGVDVVANQRSPQLGQDTRRRLKIADQALVFLSFNRLSPGTKGDHLALIVRWRDVLSRVPQAVLVLAGATVDKDFVAELRSTARQAGVANNVVILDNPFGTFSDARTRLMSAADLFLHLSTGVEEAAPMVVQEALAHSLPVIATRWAGLSETIVEGENGHLIDTRAAPLDPCVSTGHFGVVELAHALRASRAVTCAWEQLLDAVVVVADGPTRARMARAARQTAEACTPDRVARDYVTFFDAVSDSARLAWNSQAQAARLRPLVDVEMVLREQGALPIPGDRLVRLADRARADLLTPQGEGGAEPPADLLARLGPLRDGQQISLAQLAALVATGPVCEGLPSEAARLRAEGPLLMRLLNYGVFELVPPAGE